MTYHYALLACQTAKPTARITSPEGRNINQLAHISLTPVCQMQCSQ